MSRYRVVRRPDGQETIYSRVCVYQGRHTVGDFVTTPEDFFWSEPGQWVLAHSDLERPEILRHQDPQRFEELVQVWAWLSGPDITYWNLRWANLSNQEHTT